ncbi:hypothetical protein MNBD_GAMMA11-2683 [hydrothermal vent metagenome]|uniref:TusE/DsrC/DsvC family sulfur relay protein n=1 Tax=hydrothermal vent metagenome TaxID=652676 RepID=A0A3B0XFJ7_9ZZZZ
MRFEVLSLCSVKPQKMIKDRLSDIEINNGGIMNNLVINGSTVNLRNDGRLENIEDWTPVLAEQMAKNEGLSLTPAHWDVINAIREYYKEYNFSPILKLLRKELSKRFGAERASIEALDALFPNGVQQQGSRLAGIPLAHLDAELDQAARVQSVSVSTNITSHYNDQFDFNGKSIKVYTSGNLVNLEDWNDELAIAMAEKEGLQLKDEHWVIVNSLRKFYFQYGVAPMVKILIKQMSEELGSEAIDKDAMYKLFPGGPAKQGSRIAGLPSPQGCIDD